MTFIASVIAKNGVALIADSLVTTSSLNMDLSSFLGFLNKKEKETGNRDDIALEPSELFGLFKQRPSYTKNYEDKLFQLDNYTAVTTAGNAEINGKRIYKVIEGIVQKIKKAGTVYSNKSLEDKVKYFCGLLKKELEEHFKNNTGIGSTIFIYTNYDPESSETHIYKIFVNSCTSERFKDANFVPVGYFKALDIEKVVCDGQNKISEKILFGNLLSFDTVLENIVEKIIKDFNINKSTIPADYIQTLSNDEVVKNFTYDGMKITKLSELSLQQAVELANLLMRIEMDFQTYTENIPTVGGVIKIAIIDKNGFKFLSGHEITRPLHI